MSLKLDLHVHSESRGKIFINVEQLRNSLRQNKLDGVAITNFFDISHALWLKEKVKDYIIIVGQEIWTKEGHIIGLGIQKSIPNSIGVEEAIEHIHEQGGIAIAPHPYTYLGVGGLVKTISVDAIESYNAFIGAYLIPNYLARRIASHMSIVQVVGTDTSDARYLGQSYTEVFVEDGDSILESIRRGRVKLYKRALPIPFVFFLKSVLKFRNLETCSIHPAPCFICGKSITVRFFKEKFECFDCGRIEFSRIVCCNGHYFCRDCLFRRGVASSWKPERNKL